MPEPSAFEIILTVVIGAATFAIIGLALYATIVLIARALHRVMPATSPPRDPALDALRTRFANGDIDEAEFERLRSVLQRR